jgi:phage gp29-like protein
MEERDPHLHAELSKRKRAVIGLPRQVIPPPKPTRNDIKTAAMLNDVISNIPSFDDFLLDLLDAIGHGFSCCEITWEFADGIWRPAKVVHRPQHWFQLDIHTRTEIRLRNMSVDGDQLWPFGWIVHKHAAKSGEIARSGLYRVLAWPWLMKQYSLRDLAEYLEIYGLPVKIGKYPRSAPEDDKDNLYRALQQLGRNVSGIMPDDMHIEFLKESLGSATPFMKMVEYCDTAISLAIVGQTLSSTPASTGLGSGVAMLQSDVRQDLLEADAAQLSNTITNQLVYPLLALNNWGINKSFTYEIDASSTENIASFADSIQKLVAAGVEIPVDWVRRKVGVPAPEDDEETIGGKSQEPTQTPIVVSPLPVPPPQPLTPEPSENDTTEPVAALRSAVNLQPTPSNYVDTQADKLHKKMSPLIDDVLSHVRALLKESKDLHEFKVKLTQWLPEYKDPDITKLLASAFTAAKLAGRYDVSRGR